jgi:predicted phosphoadenosine phosphosulfate sulfurtransferase
MPFVYAYKVLDKTPNRLTWKSYENYLLEVIFFAAFL